MPVVLLLTVERVSTATLTSFIIMRHSLHQVVCRAVSSLILVGMLHETMHQYAGMH